MSKRVMLPVDPPQPGQKACRCGAIEDRHGCILHRMNGPSCRVYVAWPGATEGGEPQ